MTVTQLLASTSSAELTEWQAFFSLRQKGAPVSSDDKLRGVFGGPPRG